MSVFSLGVVLVRWQQSSPHRYSPSWYQDFFCDPSKPGVAHYWRQQSQGQALFSGDVFDWFDLQATIDQLKSDKPGYNAIDRTKLVTLALEQALLRGWRSVQRSGYVVVADVVPPPGMAIDAGATAVDFPPGPVPVVRGPAALFPVGSDFDFTAHEMGHVLGLNHSFGFPQLMSPGAVPGEYQHFWCIMSAQTYGQSSPQFDTSVSPAEFSRKGPGLNGGTRVHRGWATPLTIDLEPGLDASFAINSLGSPGADDRYNVIYLVATVDETYAIELRSPSDPYDAGVLCPMIVISAVAGSLADGTYPGVGCASYLGEIHKPVGGTFTGPGFEVELIMISDDDSHAIVRIKEDRNAVYIPAFFPRDRVPVYAIKQNGELVWYTHNGRDNARSAWFGPRSVGTHWDQFTKVFPGAGTVLYAVKPDGDLLWYRHLGFQDGTFNWTGPKTVGSDWDQFTQVFPGADGVIYAIKTNGDLLWYRHLGFQDGTFNWTGPKTVGSDWDQFTRVFPGAAGIIYAIASDGHLLWYRHDGRHDGTFAWTGPKTVGNDWDEFHSAFEGRP